MELTLLALKENKIREKFMVKKCLSVALLAFLLLFTNLQLINAQTNTGGNAAATEKIKAKVAKRGTGEKARVSVRMLNGTKMKGFISQSGEDSFTLTDSKTRQTTTLAYSEVAQVKGTGLSTTAKILIGVGVGVAITAVVLAVAVDQALDDLRF
jgi:sRNA-binding regulator protein Hfq